MNKLEIIQFTDPMCVWCWAIEPSLRKIEYLLQDKVELSYVMGVLTSDVRSIIGYDENAGIRFMQLKKFLKEHFHDASRRSGMPVETSHFENVEQSDITSLPMNLAYKAMQLIDENIANKFLRRMRESALSEGSILSNNEKIIHVAAEFDIDIELFTKYLTDGSAESELNNDLQKVRKYKVTGFPTLLIKYNGKETLIHGFVDFETLKKAILNISNAEIELEDKEATIENVTDYILYFEKVSPKEIDIAFTLSKVESAKMINEIIQSELFEKEIRGNGYFIKSKKLNLCDTNTGICSL